MSEPKASILLHYEEEQSKNTERFLASVQSIFEQTNTALEVVILTNQNHASIERKISEINKAAIPVHVVSNEDKSLGMQLNQAFETSRAPLIIYIDNRQAQVQLMQGAVDLFALTFERHPKGGMIYADYELEKDGQVQEIHLLKHHEGRLRDNQDYGIVYAFRKEALKKAGFADPELQFNTLYDLRLKISESFDLVHVANRYAGSLYRVTARGKQHNVFDYLLAGKDSQLEAENVLSEHLKRSGTYLNPGSHYKKRPSPPQDAELKASVIIPVNNRPEFIGMAIGSVQAQTVQDVEVIVAVNGGPQDETVKEVQRYMEGGDQYDPNKPQVQLLVYDINNLGLCLNMGAKIARGTYYVQLDSDDRLKPDAVEKILAVYESDERIGMVIGSYEVWEKQASGQLKRMENLPVVKHEEWTEENGRNNLLRINGAGAPRSIPIALIRDFLFSVNDDPFARNYGEDYDMVLRISEHHRIGRVWDAIYEVIRHEGGTDHSIDQQTIDRNDEAKDHMRLEAIRRRRMLNQAK